jgi:hypothetical protein
MPRRTKYWLSNPCALQRKRATKPKNIWPNITGQVFIRAFDQGMMNSMGGVGYADAEHPCFSVPVPYPYPIGSTQNVSAYFSQPEPIFRLKVFPFITINRDSIVPALHRWMSVGQLEYKAGVSGSPMVVNVNPNSASGCFVSGFSEYEGKIQAFPFDITYTVSCFNRYEASVHPILLYLLKQFPPLGKLYVTDSLGLPRTYEAYLEGDVANLQEIIDPVNRSRGYAITIRVEGELDLADPFFTSAVSGIDLVLHRMY